MLSLETKTQGICCTARPGSRGRLSTPKASPVVATTAAATHASAGSAAQITVLSNGEIVICAPGNSGMSGQHTWPAVGQLWSSRSSVERLDK